jgi:hypothetical protein
MHVLGPEAHAEHTRRDTAQRRKPLQELHHERRPWRGLAGEHVADDAILDEELEALRGARRPFAPLLHLVQDFERHRACAQLLPEDVGRGDGVLNGEVDADAADRRHGVRRIADAQKPRPRPALEAIDANREELHAVP